MLSSQSFRLPKKIKIGTDIFEQFHARPGAQVGIYTNEADTMIKLGKPEIISSINIASVFLLKQGFNVATVEEVGQIGSVSYFIEEKLSGLDYGKLLEETETNTQQRDLVLGQLMNNYKIFFNAQIKEWKPFDIPNFRNLIDLDSLLLDLESEDGLIVDKCITMISTKLEQLNIPLVLSHNDLHPYNIINDKVIDFEWSQPNVIGLDLLAIFQSYYFPTEGDEFRIKRSFSFGENETTFIINFYNQLFIDNSLPEFESIINELTIIKAVFINLYLSGKAHHQKYRYPRLLEMCKNYLEGSAKTAFKLLLANK